MENAELVDRWREQQGGEKKATVYNLRSILDLDGADLVEAPLHDVLALQHELTALSLEVLLLPDCDLELAHLLHLLSVHGCCFSLGCYSLSRGRGLKKTQKPNVKWMENQRGKCTNNK